MVDTYFEIERSLQMQGTMSVAGAKNAVLVIMASLILTSGISVLSNVPLSVDVKHMIALLELLGAVVTIDAVHHRLIVDTSTINRWRVDSSLMKKTRASILVMGPLLARFGRANIALPGGDAIGSRPINYHIRNFEKMGAQVDVEVDCITAQANRLYGKTIVLDYPSVGATENIIMAATVACGTTRIINAALEPEVFDLIDILQKMGACITVHVPATIEIVGVEALNAVEHSIMPDRLEAGALLLAAAMTGGTVYVPDIRAHLLDSFLYKLEEMGHTIDIGIDGRGIRLKAISDPLAVSFKTGPFPGFPTDLQAPMMAAQCIARGTSVIEETVYESRFWHVSALKKMGAHIVIDGNKAIITGVSELRGTTVMAGDIRASCAMVLAGLVARDITCVYGVEHWHRGFESLEQKFVVLGANIKIGRAHMIADPIQKQITSEAKYNAYEIHALHDTILLKTAG